MGGKPRATPGLVKWRFQEDAASATVKELQANDRAQLIMACGTGKTRVGLKVAERLETRRVLVLVPSLPLVSQTLQEWREHARRPFRALAVCSDDEATEGDTAGVTSDREDIRVFLRGEEPMVVFCTYQSADLVEEIPGAVFDLAIYDEAHKTAGNVEKFFARTLQGDWIAKRLFMTATPRVARKGEEGFFSMDDASVYGETAYRLSFRQAVEAEVICDYRIVVSVVLDDGFEPEGQVRPLAVALDKAMHNAGAEKVFSYHSTVAEARAFEKECEPLPMQLFHVNGRMKGHDRHKQMVNFEKAKRAVMTNARCLIEGVDVPAVDMVAFTSPKRSVVDIVQAAGRTMRLDKHGHKKKGTIFLPLFLRSGESVEEGLERTKYDQIYTVLQALAEHDELLAEAVRSVAKGEGSLEGKLEIEADGWDEKSFAFLQRSIGSRIVERLVNSADLNKEKLLEMARNGEERPSRKYRLGWLLSNYLNKNIGSYDPGFDEAIRAAAPHWFKKRKTKRKQRARK